MDCKSKPITPDHNKGPAELTNGTVNGTVLNKR